MHNFKELNVWQNAIGLAEMIYRITDMLPDDERFGLVAQMRRGAVSIASNIAEGAGCHSKRGFQNFLSISLGAGFELETQLIIASRLHLVSPDDFKAITEELARIQKMIVALKRKLN